MKKTICVVGLIMLPFIFSSSCSGGEDSTKNQSDTTKKEEKVKFSPFAKVEEAEKASFDSLAEKTSPVRDPKNSFVTIETDFGKMVLELYRDVAPSHADSFMARSRDGFYDGTIFHRIVKGFMIQGGDPEGTGRGGAGYFLNAEFSDLPHQDGTLSMARSTDPNSASSQFFICLGRNRSTSGLDGQYTVFGQLIRGYNVMHEIGNLPCEPNPGNPREISKPVEEVVLRRAFESDADGFELSTEENKE
ncbi:MAG: peptidylprolyl isomerase [candidate division Zixibacteria bacterium]|nr:peptidylprolyl isomerase [candidate division Zixibacteria bacterium]